MRPAAVVTVAIALALLASCGSAKKGHTPADLRGDAIRPVDRRPPEGTLSGATSGDQPERFTLRRRPGTPMRQDSVVRVDPPPRLVTRPDTAATSPPRTVTLAPAPTSSATPPPSPRESPGREAVRTEEQFLAQDPPQVLTRVPAVSPPRARAARVGGTVLVKVLVGTDGLVRATRIARSIPELDSAAVACVKQWKFKPAMSSGVPVAAWTDIPVRFLLQ